MNFFNIFIRLFDTVSVVKKLKLCLHFYSPRFYRNYLSQLSSFISAFPNFYSLFPYPNYYLCFESSIQQLDRIKQQIMKKEIEEKDSRIERLKIKREQEISNCRAQAHYTAELREQLK